MTSVRSDKVHKNFGAKTKKLDQSIGRLTCTLTSDRRKNKNGNKMSASLFQYMGYQITFIVKVLLSL